MMKMVPVLSNKMVSLVLKGEKDNEKITSSLGLKGEKNSLNYEINRAREWFDSHKREKEYALELLSYFPAEDIQKRFEHFCSMSKSMQRIAKDMLLEEKKAGAKAKSEAVKYPVYA